jgi:hypothetical protein
MFADHIALLLPGLIREVDRVGISGDYWTHSARKLHQLEQRWIAQHRLLAHTLGGETK